MLWLRGKLLIDSSTWNCHRDPGSAAPHPRQEHLLRPSPEGLRHMPRRGPEAGGFPEPPSARVTKSESKSVAVQTFHIVLILSTHDGTGTPGQLISFRNTVRAFLCVRKRIISNALGDNFCYVNQPAVKLCQKRSRCRSEASSTNDHLSPNTIFKGRMAASLCQI